MRINLRFARSIYTTVWVIVFLFAFLSESEILKTCYVKATPSLEYALNMLCIVLTLCMSWGSFRLFSLKRIKKMREERPQTIISLNLLRISLLATAIFINLIVYYAIQNSTTPLFCLLITLTAYVFCWPKEKE